MDLLSVAEVVVVLILAVAYAMGAWRLAKTAQPVPRWRLLCVGTGMAVLLATMLVLREPGKELVYWRTVEHLLIADLGAGLIAIGLTAPLLAPLASSPLRRLTVLSRPSVALALWVANLVAWQWPGAFDASLRHDWLTLIENVLLIALSLNMWRALLASMSASQPQMGYRSRIAYVLIARIVGIVLACIGIWSPDVYYPYFLRSDTALSTSPLADQGIAGAIMLAEMALIAIGLLLWMGVRVSRPAPLAQHSIADAEPTQPASSGALAMDAQA